jgi:lipopolysaccharide/colanic/teichoic acid biosynthesis glycosyltransferase
VTTASLSHSNISGFNLTTKRVFDLIVLGPILLVVAPLMLLVALAIRFVDGRPILFRQVRLGKDGKPFGLLKFRTMRHASDAAHREYAGKWISQGRAFANGGAADTLYKIADDPRVTRLGAVLRRFSIDELPQLINVLRGEMSLIGPRPAIPYEVQMYQEWHRRRLDAMPGLTGLWQVSGRNRLSFDQMVRLDIDYIEHWSLLRDLAILARTPYAVIEGDGQ